MAFRISGFGAEQREKKEMVSAYEASRRTVAPRKSLVQVRFPGKGMALTYFNDLFDLNVGDRVYVDGKLEGQLGLVVEISYNFKIKVSDYKKVIAGFSFDRAIGMLVFNEYCLGEFCFKSMREKLMCATFIHTMRFRNSIHPGFLSCANCRPDFTYLTCKIAKAEYNNG